jgi:hypothetical protein
MRVRRDGGRFMRNRVVVVVGVVLLEAAKIVGWVVGGQEENFCGERLSMR